MPIRNTIRYFRLAPGDTLLEQDGALDGIDNAGELD
jgi:hypothetical protein